MKRRPQAILDGVAFNSIDGGGASIFKHACALGCEGIVAWSHCPRKRTHYCLTVVTCYKTEKWSRNGLRVELMLCAGSSLDKARPRDRASFLGLVGNTTASH